MSDATNHPIAKALDVVAIGSLISTFAGWLPTVLSIVASTLSIVWFCIQIYESNTFKKWFCRKTQEK